MSSPHFPLKAVFPIRRPRLWLAFSLLLGLVLWGQPSAVSAQTCAEDSAAVNNRGAALAGDCTALLGLKDTLRGTASLNWSTTLNMDAWEGITVLGSPARVIQIKLRGRGLSGSLPTALNTLTSLWSLDLASNQLTGLPALSGLTQLNFLNLYDNQLSSLPDLSALTKLTSLHLYGNRLTTFSGLNAPTSLTFLSLYGNQLTTLSDLSGLTSLTSLHLSYNQLSSLPDLSALTSLKTLSLSGNQLSSLPDLSDLTRLKALSLSDNQLSSLSDLSALTNLTFLDLAGNNLSSLSGLNAPTSLTFLDLAGNQLSSLPDLSALTSLRILDLSHNQLSSLPGVSSYSKLEYLDLSANAFTAGGFPTLHSKASDSLTHLLLRNTNRTGAFPALSHYSKLVHLDLSANAFTAGVIPDLSALTQLTHLKLRQTQRTGAIPTTLGSLSQLQVLDLSENSLSGSIPSQLSSLSHLTHLYLNNNQLTGSLPAGLTPTVLRLGSNTSTFGRPREISLTTTADSLSTGFTFDATSDPCGSLVAGTALPAAPTLREALIYANSTDTAEALTFAQSLHGQTLTLADGTDTGTDADPLPALCGGSLTLNGDSNGDGVADITLDGTGLPTGTDGLTLRSSTNTLTHLKLTNIPNAGLVVRHTTAFSQTVATNTLADNTITGGQYGLLVQAGAGSTAGAVSGTTIRDNTITKTTGIGIAVVTAVAGSTITDTTLEANEVYANTGTGIAAWSTGVNTTQVKSITKLKMEDNHVHDHPAGSGIVVVSGFCGGAYNRVEAEITDNTLSKNGKAGAFADITVGAGSNAAAALQTCPTLPNPNTTGNNVLEITLSDNLSEDTPSVGLAVFGGVRHSDSNTVTATLEGNTIWRSGQAGIRVRGGTDNADSNTVTVTLNDNLIARTTALPEGTAGHGLVLEAAAATPADSTSSSNTLTVNGQGNMIQIARNSTDTSQYDLYRRQHNDTTQQRTGNTVADTLSGTLFGTESNDWAETVTPVVPVTIPANHAQVQTATVTPVAASGGAGPPSPTQFSAGGQVFNITVRDSQNTPVTTTLSTPVTVCLPIPAGVSPSNAYILRYNAPTKTWERQTAGRTTTGGQVCANVSQFSLFTVRTSLSSGGGGGGGNGDGSGDRGGGSDTSAPAVVRGFLESPASGAVVSGVDLIRGWSFAEGAGVTIAQVEFFLDGQAQATIPCCSSRADVAGAFPALPAAGQSGWGLTWNWGNLSAGPHRVQVVATSTEGAQWTSPPHTVTVVKPGGIAFADQFSLAEAEARLVGSELVLDGVVVRDKATQVEEEVAVRYAWQTGAQGLRLVASRTLEVARAPTWGVERLLAGVWDWGQHWLSPASVTANEGLEQGWEAPGAGEAVAGVSLLRGWVFPEDESDEIASVTVTIDGTVTERAPCCSARPDVAGAFPAQANAELSGWGLVYNYGNLSDGQHHLVTQVTTAAGVVAAPVERTVTVARLGGYAFVDQFELSGATVDVVGEEILLNGVVVRDSASQQTQTIGVRLRWAVAPQGLVIVGTTSEP